MPTFLSRRYMRDRVPRREKTIGAVILLILGGIAVVFVCASLNRQAGLFELAPGTERSSESGGHVRELRVARAMMPPLGTAGWALDEAITVKAAADLLRPLADYGVGHLFEGRYVNLVEPGQVVAVQIYETAAPRNAMALFHLLAPQDRQPLPAGNGGWVRGDRSGFWAGRYYTQFDRSAVRTEQPGIKVITDALASVQITYGPPFWAEEIFPSDGQLAGSFRYAPMGLPSLPALAGCFAVTYDDGTIALAKRAESAAEAGQLLRRVADELSGGGSLAQTPSADQPVLSGPLGEGFLFVFAHAGTICGSIGPDAGTVSDIASQMLERVRPASVAVTSSAGAAARDESPFPLIDLPGWRPPDNTRVFTATNLWEKIDGRADLYLTYNVSTLTFGTYRGDSGLALDVYWYDMTELDNAFGIYRAEYGGYAEPVSVGREGYRAASSVFFWTGAHYVRVEASQESAELTEAAEAVAAAIAAAVPDDGKLLWADALLPREGRRPGSFEYQGENAFGLDFLTAVFSADYEVEGQDYKLFIHRAPDTDSAAKTSAAYLRFFEEYGKVLDRGSTGSGDVLIGESGGVIDAVFVSGSYVGGVSGADDASLARRAALAFRASLAAASPPTEGGE
ncbi:MAG: DUF6599 family protein [Planctomycetota bacterium]